MRVAVMVKNGLTSQKIADMLNVSLHTVKSHRKNLRKKLNIQKSDISLGAYLKSKIE
jgi:DNA-binding CsgD family transcriptional regulator